MCRFQVAFAVFVWLIVHFPFVNMQSAIMPDRSIQICDLWIWILSAERKDIWFTIVSLDSTESHDSTDSTDTRL